MKHVTEIVRVVIGPRWREAVTRLRSLSSGAVAFAVALAFAACGDGSGAGDASTSSAELGTLAYVVSRCRIANDTAFFGQELRIRRGDSEPITVWQAEGPPIDAAAPLVGLPFNAGLACAFVGGARNGLSFVFAGALQYLSVSAGGDTVAFEVAGRFSVLPKPIVAADEEGIFLVNSDGTGLRRVAPASVVPAFYLASLATTFPAGLLFSPDGRKLVYVDEASEADGEAPLQVFTLDVETGERRQVTHLPPGSPPLSAADGSVRLDWARTAEPVFLDDRTIAFLSTSGLSEPSKYRAFTIRDDGSQLTGVPLLAGAADEAEVVPIYAITGEQPDAFSRTRPGEPLNGPTTNPLDMFIYGPADFIRELWVVNGQNTLQLTRFERWDTAGVGEALDNEGGRVFFVASPDPLGTNPTQNCQIFSIDVTGADLRQVTFFDEVDTATSGCAALSQKGYGCLAEFLFQDVAADRLVFHSTCDPFGTNPNGGEIFAVNHDGSDLRQLTDTRGMVEEPDGSVLIELPMPFAYPSLRPGGRSR